MHGSEIVNVCIPIWSNLFNIITKISYILQYNTIQIGTSYMTLVYYTLL